MSRRARRAVAPTPTAPATSRAASVGPLQRWFQAAVMHPQGSAAPLARRRLATELLPSATLSAAERLDLYAHSYFLRLRDVLRHDFAGLLHALGDAEFDRLARRYVAAHPSRSFTLNDFAQRLPRFVARAPLPPRWRARRRFLVELATLERAVDRLFHAPHVPPLAPSALGELAPADWASAQLRPIAAARLFAFRHPVNRWLQAVYDGAKPTPPARDELPSFLLVHRHEWRVWRSTLSEPQHALLAALFAGVPLAKAVQRAARVGGKEPLLRIGEWFREWSGAGLFAAIERDGTAPRARGRKLPGTTVDGNSPAPRWTETPRHLVRTETPRHRVRGGRR
ncbi:MAG: putative DNA-binding domain-containing protein [Planctomycetes bacterium]|nr:putative DNA-binding domain-containing protein [Planctomycetota bacterium]